MRVLHVIPAVGPSYGGPSRAIVGMTESLVARGIDVDVATTDRDGAARLDVPLDRVVEQDGVNYRYFATVPSGEWKFSWTLARWLRSHVSRYDLVHVHGLFSFSTIPACRTARAVGVPYVLRPLGMLAEASLSFRAWKKWPYYALVEHAHLQHASAIHVTSPNEEHAVRSRGFGAQARLVPLGVDMIAPRHLVELRDSRRPVRVLYLGRLHPIKQLPWLLQSFAKLVGRTTNAVELVLAGGGEESHRLELEQLVTRLGLTPHVRFTGALGQAEARLQLQDADLFVLPSRTENFGLAAAEALAAGLPVIVSDQVGLASDVSAMRAGRVVESGSPALVDALYDLVSSAELRSSMSLNARRLAEEQYSWSRSAETLVALYEELQHQRHEERGLVEVS